MISGFGFRVSGFVFRDSEGTTAFFCGLTREFFRVSCFAFRVSRFAFCVSCFIDGMLIFKFLLFYTRAYQKESPTNRFAGLSLIKVSVKFAYTLASGTIGVSPACSFFLLALSVLRNDKSELK